MDRPWKRINPVVGAHFLHDTFSAFFPVILPRVIEKLSLSLTQAGMISAFMQIPAMLNPIIGFLADKYNLIQLLILAPAITATTMGLLGLANNVYAASLILILTGISVASFHAPAPGVIGKTSGNSIGRGMSYFMAAGELGRTVGPLLAVWAISQFTLEGYYPIMLVGWAASIILYSRLKDIRISVRGTSKSTLDWKKLTRVFTPITIYLTFRLFMSVSLTTYLPIYMESVGRSSWVGGAVALSVLELAGVLGALLSGTLSDRFGRRQILFIVTLISAILMLIFVNVSGMLVLPTLFVLGFFALSTTPVILAIIQDQFATSRSTSNGIFMFISFLMRSLVVFFLGVIGDHFSLQNAYLISGFLAFLSLPAIFFIPENG